MVQSSSLWVSPWPPTQSQSARDEKTTSTNTGNGDNDNSPSLSAASSEFSSRHNNVDVMYSIIGAKEPPALPLREEVRTQGVELVYNARGVGQTVVSLERKRREKQLLEKLKEVETKLESKHTYKRRHSEKRKNALRMVRDLRMKMENIQSSGVSYNMYLNELRKMKMTVGRTSGRDITRGAKGMVSEGSYTTRLRSGVEVPCTIEAFPSDEIDFVSMKNAAETPLSPPTYTHSTNGGIKASDSEHSNSDSSANMLNTIEKAISDSLRLFQDDQSSDEVTALDIAHIPRSGDKVINFDSTNLENPIGTSERTAHSESNTNSAEHNFVSPHSKHHNSSERRDSYTPREMFDHEIKRESPEFDNQEREGQLVATKMRIMSSTAQEEHNATQSIETANMVNHWDDGSSDDAASTLEMRAEDIGEELSHQELGAQPSEMPLQTTGIFPSREKEGGIINSDETTHAANRMDGDSSNDAVSTSKMTAEEDSGEEKSHKHELDVQAPVMSLQTSTDFPSREENDTATHYIDAANVANRLNDGSNNDTVSTLEMITVHSSGEEPSHQHELDVQSSDKPLETSSDFPSKEEEDITTHNIEIADVGNCLDGNSSDDAVMSAEDSGEESSHHEPGIQPLNDLPSKEEEDTTTQNIETIDVVNRLDGSSSDDAASTVKIRAEDRGGELNHHNPDLQPCEMPLQPLSDLPSKEGGIINSGEPANVANGIDDSSSGDAASTLKITTEGEVVVKYDSLKAKITNHLSTTKNPTSPPQGEGRFDSLESTQANSTAFKVIDAHQIMQKTYFTEKKEKSIRSPTYTRPFHFESDERGHSTRSPNQSSSDTKVSDVTKVKSSRPPTDPKPFHFESDERGHSTRLSKQSSSDSGVSYVTKVKSSRPLTDPRPFQLESDERGHSTRLSNQRSSDTGVSYVTKKVKSNKPPTDPRPFHFESDERGHSTRLLKQSSSDTGASYVSKKVKSNKLPTITRPFHFKSDKRGHSTRLSKQSSSDMESTDTSRQETRSARNRYPNNAHQSIRKPALVRKKVRPNKPPTIPKPFDFESDKRGHSSRKLKPKQGRISSTTKRRPN